MAGHEDGGIGISQKNSHGPLPRFHPSAVPDGSTHAWSNPWLPPCSDTRPLHRGSSRPVESVTRNWHQIREPLFWNSFPSSAPRNLPSGFTRCAIPQTVPARKPLRKRPRLSRGPRLRQIAHRVFVAAGSGALAAGRRCRAKRRGWRDRYLSKKFSWPPAALPSLCRSRRLHTRVDRPRAAAVLRHPSTASRVIPPRGER